ncbi:MAG: bifunctional hydroxymethylpyrimidine kinase/phosphomethylpyrimidine kinase [Planctomycetota bacterium]
MTTPRVLCLSGLDPAGAAGLARDLWALARAGGRGLPVPTCLTVQSSRRFVSLEPTPPAWLAEALRLARADEAPEAAKVGLVADAATPALLAEGLAGIPALVVDPVRAPSLGGAGHGDEVARALRAAFAPLAPVWTPNLPELAWLCGTDDPLRAARALLDEGARGVLVKGGHAGGPELVDLWVEAGREQELRRPRIGGPPRRGTGCVLASLLALELARGQAPLEAARDACDRLGRLWAELDPWIGEDDSGARDQATPDGER